MYENNLSNLPYIDYESIFAKISRYFSTIDFSAWLVSFLASLTYLKFISTVATLLFSIGIFYSALRLAQIRHKESLIYNAQLPQVYEMPGAQAQTNKKWERILLHVESPNSNDWKVAIIEADILLGEMLGAMGYQGESIGEKLKRVEPGDLTTLDQAWEAHKIRNAIAHQGGGFEINQREAKRVISMYQAVLDEFQSKTQS